MHRVIPWQIVMVLVAIGTYVAVLASGGSERAAVTFAVTFAVAFTIVTFAAAFTVAFAVVFTALAALAAAFTAAAFTVIPFAAAVFTTAALPNAHAAVVATLVVVAAVVAVLAVVFTAAFVATAVAPFAATAEDLGIPKRWMLAAFGIGVGAVSSALLTGSVWWAIAIGTIGIAALLAVWRFGPHTVVRTMAPASNGG